MNATNPNTITTAAAPAGETPVARTAQNITVEQRATIDATRRGRQTAPAPSSPATNRAAATNHPATAAAPSEGQPAAQPGAEPTPAAAAAPASAAAPAVAPTPAEALANAAEPAAAPGEPAPDNQPTAPAPAQQPGANSEPHLNGEAPDWLQPLLAGDNTVVPIAVKQMGKRIGELTYRLRTAEAALAAGAGEVQSTVESGLRPETSGHRPDATADRPNVQTTAPAPASTEYDQVQARIQHEWNVVEWCEKNRNGGTVTLKGGAQQEFTADEVAAQLVNSQRALKDLEKAQNRIEDQHRARVTQTFEQSRAEAARKYAWMADVNTPESREAKAYLDANPHMLRDPQWPLVVGRYVTGLLAERKATTSTPPPVAPPLARPRATGNPAPVPGAPSSQAPRVDPKAAELARLKDDFRKTGSVKTKQKIFALERSMPQGAAA